MKIDNGYLRYFNNDTGEYLSNTDELLTVLNKTNEVGVNINGELYFHNDIIEFEVFSGKKETALIQFGEFEVSTDPHDNSSNATMYGFYCMDIPYIRRAGDTYGLLQLFELDYGISKPKVIGNFNQNKELLKDSED